MPIIRRIRYSLNNFITNAADNVSVVFSVWAIWGICFSLSVPHEDMSLSYYGGLLFIASFICGIFFFLPMGRRHRWWAIFDISCALSSVVLLVIALCGVSQDHFGTIFGASIAVWLAILTASE